MKDIYHSNNISVVVDNNILVDLFELNQLDLLFQVFDQVYIPQIIYMREVPQPIKNDLTRFPFTMGILSTEVGQDTYAALLNDPVFKRLSMMDRMAIAIAKENLFYCNSNDLLVRKACEKYSVHIIGILGIVGRAYIQKLIDKDTLLFLLDELTSDHTTCYIDIKYIVAFKEDIFDLKS